MTCESAEGRERSGAFRLPPALLPESRDGTSCSICQQSKQAVHQPQTRWWIISGTIIHDQIQNRCWFRSSLLKSPPFYTQSADQDYGEDWNAYRNESLVNSLPLEELGARVAAELYSDSYKRDEPRHLFFEEQERAT